MPLAHTHPRAATECFWSAEPMRRETQVRQWGIQAASCEAARDEVLAALLLCMHTQPADAIPLRHDAHQRNAQVHILRCTALLARHFAASSMSLAVTRSFDASRILTFGCMAAITDAVMRVAACDTPSRLSAHYAGTAGGPASPFGFELSCDFAVQSEQMKFVDPAMAVARAQVGSVAVEALYPRTQTPKTMKTGKNTLPACRPWPIQLQAKQTQIQMVLPAPCSLLHAPPPLPCGSLSPP